MSAKPSWLPLEANRSTVRKDGHRSFWPDAHGIGRWGMGAFPRFGASHQISCTLYPEVGSCKWCTSEVTANESETSNNKHQKTT